MKDEDIIDAIREGGRACENAIKILYERDFSLVKQFAYRYRGKLDEKTVLDLYSDVIIVFREHIRNDRFKGKSKIFSYLFSILSNKCVDAAKKMSTQKRSGEMIDEMPENLSDPRLPPDEQLIRELSYRRLLCYISHLGDSCQQLLVDAYYWEYSRDEIAERMNFKDSRVVRSRLFTCKGQLKNLLNRSDICQELDPVEAE